MKNRSKDICKSKHSPTKTKTTLCMPKSSKNSSQNWKFLLKEISKEKIDGLSCGKYKHKTRPKCTKTFRNQNKVDPVVWFDGVSKEDILVAEGKYSGSHKTMNIGTVNNKNSSTNVNKHDLSKLSKVIAMDCEMVGVGYQGNTSALARVSIVNEECYCVYDKYVKPIEKVTNYRTNVSGITPQDLKNGEDFKSVQNEVAAIIKDRTIVGHALWNDLKVLLLTHPKRDIRDSATYSCFQKYCKKRNPSLKLLCKEILGITIQKNEHNSIEDCQAVMKLYVMHKKQWEADIINHKFKKQKK